MLAEGISCLADPVSMAKADLLAQLRYLRIMAGKIVSVISNLVNPNKIIVHDRKEIRLKEYSSVMGLNVYTSSSEYPHTCQLHLILTCKKEGWTTSGRPFSYKCM